MYMYKCIDGCHMRYKMYKHYSCLFLAQFMHKYVYKVSDHQLVTCTYIDYHIYSSKSTVPLDII